MRKFTNENGSIVLILAVLVFTVVFITISMSFLRTRTSSRSGLSETIVTQGLEIADVGIQQILGDIQRRHPDLEPDDLDRLINKLEGKNGYSGGEIEKISRAYQVRKSTSTGYLLYVATATLSLVPYQNDPATKKSVTDIEDNPVYQIISRSTIFSPTGETMSHKTVKAAISIINLAKYSLVNIGTYRSGWYPDYANILDGFMHINTDLNIHGFNFANCLYLPDDISNLGIAGFNNDGNWSSATDIRTTRYFKNPHYSPQYTVAVAGHIKKMDYHNGCDYAMYTQGQDDLLNENFATLTSVTEPITPLQYETLYSRRAYYSHNYTGQTPNETLIGPNPSYTEIKTIKNDLGTWFDGTHGGFKLTVPSLDYSFFYANADVIINEKELNNGIILGSAGKDFSKLAIDLHDGPAASARTAIEIDLGALGTGSPRDVCKGMTNYNTALNDQYGLVIYINGWVGLHGKLTKSDNPVINYNKKVTIVTTQGVNVIGDVLYSGDSYFQVLDNCTITSDPGPGWVAVNGATAINPTPGINPATGENTTPFNPSETGNTFDPKCLKVSMTRAYKTGVTPAQASFIKNNCLVVAPTTYTEINNGTIYPFNIADNKISLNVYLGGQAPFAQSIINLRLKKQNGTLIKELPSNNSNQIVLNEICFAPPSSNTQWVEIFNRHPSTVYNLVGWQFFDGSSTHTITASDFVGGTGAPDRLLGPGEYALIVQNWANFRTRYNNNIPSNLDVVELSSMSLDQDGNPGIYLIDPNGNQTEPQYAYTHPTVTVNGSTPHPDWSDCSWERVNYYSTLPGIWEVNNLQSKYSSNSQGIGTPGYQNRCFRSWARVIVTGLTANESADLNRGSVSLIFSDYTKGGVGRNGDLDNWTYTNLTTATVYALAAVLPNNAAYAGTAGMGVFRTTNSGSSWERLVNANIPLGLINADVYSLAIDPSNSNSIYAGTRGSGIYQTTDGGNSWSPIGGAVGLSTHTIFSLGIKPNEPNIIYAGTDGSGIYRTTDSGNSWSQVGPANASVYALLSGFTDTYAGTDGLGVYKSVGGIIWSPLGGGLPTGTTVYALAFNPDSLNKTIYAGTKDLGIFKTSDYGNTWSNINGGVLDNRTVYSIFHFGGGLIVGTDNGIYQSSDEGANWSVPNTGLPDKLTYAVAGTPQLYYAGTSGATNFWVDELAFSLGKSYPVNARFERLNQTMPNPANLYDDAIAIISNNNIYVDTWHLHQRGHFDLNSGQGRYVPVDYESSKYFVNNGDYQKAINNNQIYYSGMKTSCLYYFNVDRTGMSYISLSKNGKPNPSQQLFFETFYGTFITKSTRGGCAVESQHFYDADLIKNISRIIPIGAGILSWQQIGDE